MEMWSRRFDSCQKAGSCIFRNCSWLSATRNFHLRIPLTSSTLIVNNLAAHYTVSRGEAPQYSSIHTAKSRVIYLTLKAYIPNLVCVTQARMYPLYINASPSVNHCNACNELYCIWETGPYIMN